MCFRNESSAENFSSKLSISSVGNPGSLMTCIVLANFCLTLRVLGNNFSRHLKIFFLFFPENRGYKLHEMSEPVIWEKYEKHHQFVVY